MLNCAGELSRALNAFMDLPFMSHLYKVIQRQNTKKCKW